MFNPLVQGEGGSTVITEEVLLLSRNCLPDNAVMPGQCNNINGQYVKVRLSGPGSSSQIDVK